jgi:ATP-dependent Zn protease
MTRSKKALASTAYHEAGHAVACVFAEGQPIGIRKASIVPDDAEGTLGHVLQKRSPAWLRRDIESGFLSPRAERACMNRAVVLLAGKAAADRYHGRRGNRGSAVYATDPKYGRVIVDGDQHRAVDWLAAISRGDPEETGLLWRLAEHRARRLVEVRWDNVERLAGALLERRTLTVDEVRDVMFSKRHGPVAGRERTERHGG